MVEVTIEGSLAVFTVQGWDKLWSFRSRVEIPLKHIEDVHADPSPPMGWFQGLKMLGADVPHLFRAGTFYQEGGWVFWDVRHKEQAIVVELRDETFQKLVVEVSDPQATIALLQDAIARANRSH
jgi:hypothetical protein